MGRFLLIVCLSLGGLGGMGGCGGCGDDSKVGRLPDAPPPPPDAPIDVPIDAPPLPVKLTIARNGSPAADVQVYFQNADNSVVKSIKSDAMGTAEAVMEAGGSVTAINPFTTVIPAITGRIGDQLRTFVGVKPGDQLFLTLNDDTSESVSVSVTVPEADAVTSYHINTTCGSGTIIPPPPAVQIAALPGSISVPSNCDTADFLVLAHGLGVDDNDIGIGGLSAPDVDLTPQGGVDLSGGSYRNTVSVPFHYTHAPSDVEQVSASHYFISGRGMFVDSYGGGVPIDGVSHEGMTSFPEPDFDPVLAVLDSFVNRVAPHNIVTWGAKRSQYDIDLADLLRDVSGPPDYDQSAQQVQWTEADGGATPDLSLAQILVDRVEVRSWQWVIVAPYTRGRLQLPTVPDDIFDYMPAANDTVEVDDLVNAKVTFLNPGGTGYDAVRGHILDIHEIGRSTSFATGAAGQVSLVGPGVIPERGTPKAIAHGPVRRLVGPPIHSIHSIHSIHMGRSVRPSRKAAAVAPVRASSTVLEASPAMLSPGHLPGAAR